MRSGKGRLRVDSGVETVDIKVRVSSEVAEELSLVARKLGVPMAKIVREGVEIRLEQLQAQIQENEKELTEYEQTNKKCSRGRPK